jgi:hypothetical protein
MTKFLSALFMVIILMGFLNELSHCETVDVDRFYNLLDKGDAEAVRSVWKDLKIEEALFPGEKLNVGNTPLYCPTKIGKVVLLEITTNASQWWDWRYLLFRQDKQGWRYLGHIDLEMQKYDQPSYRTIQIGDSGCWFVVYSMAGGGTGIVEYVDTWYDLTNEHLQSVLKYPNHGYISGWKTPFDRDYRATLLTTGEKDGQYSIEIQFDAKYTNSGFYQQKYPAIENLGLLFSISKTARYVRNAGQRNFVIDTVRSELSEEQIWGIVTESPDEFLKTNFADLANMAESDNPDLRFWLGKFLNECGQTVMKQALLERLRKYEDSRRQKDGVNR